MSKHCFVAYRRTKLNKPIGDSPIKQANTKVSPTKNELEDAAASDSLDNNNP